MDATEFAFYRRWIWANGWAELLGLGGSMALGWLGAQALASVGDSPAVILGSTVAAIVLGTCLEGVLVGYAQARVLRATVPALSPQAWIVATAVGAAIAWTLGMIPSTIMSLVASPEAGAEPPPFFEGPLQYSLAAGLGLVLGCFLGTPQWRVLRRHAARSGWWIGANALAWAVGMPLVFLGMGSLPVDAGWARVVGTVGLTCLGTGVVVGAVHGPVLIALLRRPPTP